MHPLVITDNEPELAALLKRTKRVAVLGCKPETRPTEPAYYVPAYLASVGVEVIPVPVYYPELTTMLGKPVVRKLAEVPPPIDIIDVFRRSSDVKAHYDDIIAAKPYAVWLQTGIRDDVTAERLAEAGIRVVQGRCLMVEYRQQK